MSLEPVCTTLLLGPARPPTESRGQAAAKTHPQAPQLVSAAMLPRLVPLCCASTAVALSPRAFEVPACPALVADATLMSERPKRSRAGQRSLEAELPRVPVFGSIFRTAVVPDELDAVHGIPYLRAESAEQYLFVRLAGSSDDRGGLYRFALLLPDRPPLLQCVSLRGSLWARASQTRVSWTDLSEIEATAVLDVLEDPPAGGQRIRPPYIPVRPRPPPPMPRPCPLSGVPDLSHLLLEPSYLPQRSLAEILSDASGPVRQGPSQTILDDLRLFGVLNCALASEPTATIVYNTFITAVKRVARRHAPADQALEYARANPTVVCPDPGALIQALPSAVGRRRTNHPESCPTLLSCLGRHPIHLPHQRYYTTNQLLSLFGHCPTSPFSAAVRLLSPENVCRHLHASLSMHVMVSLLSACRARGYLPAGLWTVVTAFSGLNTIMEAIRLMRPPQSATLLAASERNATCRQFTRGLFPHLHQFPEDSLSASATTGAPDCTLLFMGSPCVTWSDANRVRTAADLEAALEDLLRALQYFSVSRPSIRLLVWENVASLMSPELETYSERIFAALFRLSPHVSCGLLCSSQFNPAMLRPRLYTVVRFPDGYSHP